MLLELLVKNLALAEDVSIEFGNGLNVLTGETGAGKSIIVGALDFLLGGKTHPDMIRSGAEFARVEGVFNVENSCQAVKIIKGMDIEYDDDNPSVIVSREISRTGRSKCKINGNNATVSQLRSVSSSLIDICGQHENQSLFHKARQLDLIDQAGGSELINLRNEINRIYRELSSSLTEYKNLSGDAREKARRLDLLTHQLNEIRNAHLEDIDEEALSREKMVLANADKLLSDASRAYELIYEGDPETPSIIDSTGKMLSFIEAMAKVDDSLTDILNRVSSINDDLVNVAREIRHYKDSIDYDPNRLSQIEEILDNLNRLKRKYGDSIQDIIQYGDIVKSDIESINTSEERLDKLSSILKKLSDSYLENARTINEMRIQVSFFLKKHVESELKDLNMPHAVFQVNVSTTINEQNDDITGKPDDITGDMPSGFGPYGIDSVEFLLSANPGEQAGPINKIASGGELSRILLALKLVLGRFDEIPTSVFDEIDAGIGGRTASSVATRLARVSANRQVICVTHLAQIASMADRHFNIRKEVADGRTKTSVYNLSRAERIDELARMLGSESTTATIAHVQEMLDNAEALKASLLTKGGDGNGN